MLFRSTGELRGECTVLVRPERLRLVGEVDGVVAGTVAHVVFAGPFTHVHVGVAGTVLQAVVPNDGTGAGVQPGGRVGLSMPAGSLRVMAAQSAVAAR